jgi:hypothetical protein
MNSTDSEASSEYIESGEPLVLNEAVLNLEPGTAHGALRPNIAPQFFEDLQVNFFNNSVGVFFEKFN